MASAGESKEGMDETLFLGVDGGGTACRTRLESENGRVLGEGLSGPATTRLGLNNALLSVLAACRSALTAAGLNDADLSRIHAGIGLAGMGRKGVPGFLAAWPHPFASAAFEGDAYIACLGAHGFNDGGVVIVGTGSIGYARLGGGIIRLGGYGFPTSDEASGADLGLNALRLALQAIDGRIEMSPLLTEILNRFSNEPAKVTEWADTATATDYASFAPLVVKHAAQNDNNACCLIKEAVRHVEKLVHTLHSHGARRIALMGGLATVIQQWLGRETRALIVKPLADPLGGAILLAKSRLEQAKYQ